MTDTSQLKVYKDGSTDNARWERFTHRAGDIVVATPAKCGTTWTQTIVASLLFPKGDCPQPVVIIAPWVDGRIEPIERRHGASRSSGTPPFHEDAHARGRRPVLADGVVHRRRCATAATRSCRP